MPKRPAATRINLSERLRVSPNFALSLSMDGRAYVAKTVEPYVQYWLSDRERMLFSLFARRGGLSVGGAIKAAARFARPTQAEAEPGRLARAIRGMREAGVLIGLAEDTSRYDASMAEAYLTHRPFPRPLAEHMIREGEIGSDSAVLDLASGPGSLALELAKASSDVTIMELSRGFLDAACARAEASGVRLTAIHESCNRLVHHDQSYDVITVSQALHWLDDVMVCKGVCRLLRSHGSFFVVHGALTLRDDHPLSYILGDRTPLGDKAPGAFAAEAAALARRTSLLFAALDAPDVQRVDPTHRGGACAERIRLAGVRMFRQRRPIGEGFARAFLAPAHVAALGMSAEAFWADLAARCAAADDTQTLGVQDWAVLHFRRGGRTEPTQGRDADEVAEIGWDG